MAKTLSVQRTLKALRTEGYTCDIVERFVQGGAFMMRKDFLGFADIICITPEETLAVQACGTDFSTHKRKMLDNENVARWNACSNRRIELWGWRKVLKKRGGKQKIWMPRVEII